MTGKYSNGLLFHPFNNNENIVYYPANTEFHKTSLSR